ncbi:flagellar motor protein MotB [Pandoraea bronchicola]|uniref:Flagellar motor protein MotB n=2 Tax=Pandoraea bronchicola TaxID=2508287 RepID=A0A5E5BVL3_9BURK|nr:flagellar motor protein MotB [Pandoraea bronchicola]
MVALAAALALAVLWLVSPVATDVAILLTMVIAALALLAVWLGGGRAAVQPSEGVAAICAAMHATLGDIPAEQLARMPVLLAVGDGLPSIFDRAGHDSLVHHRAGAIWLRVDNPADLPQLAFAVKQWRNGIPPEGAVITVSPGLHVHADSLERMLRGVRQALAGVARSVGEKLPGYVAVYQRLSPGDSASTPEWFGVASERAAIESRQLEGVVTSAEQAAQRAGGEVTALARAAALASIVPWSARILLASLTDADLSASPVRVQGVAWIDCGPATNWQHSWERGVAVHTRVRPASAQASTQPWPLPHPFLAAIHRRPHLSALSRTVVHALTLLACASTFAFWAAGKNNESLLSRVQGHLARYAAVEPGHDVAKRDALQTLVSDRNQLDRYARLGVPLRLSFGMYRGAYLMDPLDKAIASYVPPEAPPSVITLDSMSLFDSGKATLKPGSTKLMVDAVEMIKAHADKRVLVAGYTDNVGTSDFNLKLSKARAEAVRDWLAEASGIASTQFAIQGYGDTRPIASNGTDAGRAKNRRVEITLVPDFGA